MIVVGLDTASNRWHMVGVGDKSKLPIDAQTRRATEHEHKALKDKNPDHRRNTLHSEAKKQFCRLTNVRTRPYQQIHIFCEEPLALRNGKTTRLLGLACGAIWAAHLEFDLYWHWVDVASWKKDVIGKGNASKGEIMTWSMAHGGHADWDEDHHDAFAIGTYGVELMAKQ